MMTPRRRHAVGPVVLAVIGIAVMLTGIGLHWWRPDRHTEIEWIPQLIGAAIAFAGFYAMDPKGAKDGGAFLVDVGTRIVGVAREGRRATDPMVVQQIPIARPSDEALRPPAPDTPPSGGFPPSEGA